MNKIFMLICAGIICFSCNDKQAEPQCPVTEIEMPASDAASPIAPGSLITIQGRGFSADCQIWLHSVTRTQIQARITNISATDLTFTAPTVSGEQTVVLKQDGGSFELGSLFFDTPSDDNPVEILPKRVSYLRITYPDDMTFSCRFTYNTQGQIVSTTDTDFQYTQPNIPIPADRTTTYTYTQTQITSQDNTDPAQVFTETFDLENARTVKYTWTNQNYDYSDYYSFSYDSKGYLSGSTWTTNENNSSESGSYSVIGSSLERIQTQGGKDEDFYIATTRFTNTPTQLNNLNIDLFGLEDLYIEELPVVTPAFLLGVSGSRFSTLPASCTRTITEKDPTGAMAESEEEIYTYKYEMKGEYISRVQIYWQERLSAQKELSAQIEFFYEE